MPSFFSFLVVYYILYRSMFENNFPEPLRGMKMHINYCSCNPAAAIFQEDPVHENASVNRLEILPQRNSQTMVASEKTSTKPNQDYFNSVFKSKIYFWYTCAHALPNKEARQGPLGQTAARESQKLLKIRFSNVEQHLKSKARLIGQLWMGNSDLPNISVRQK